MSVNGYFFCRQFDTREPHTCREDDKVLLIDLQRYLGPNSEPKCIAINPRRPEQLAVGANDPYARLYDRRMITLEKVCGKLFRMQFYYFYCNDNKKKYFITLGTLSTWP